jgi:O-antigen chain-terminating methyltransferase
MTADDDRIFKEHVCGVPELFKLRLKQYLPFLIPLNTVYPGAPVLEIGRRCEAWQDLLTGIGFRASGAALDSGTSRDDSIPGVVAEAQKSKVTGYFADLPANSQVVVSAFHIIESISRERLFTVFSDALRVLKPGGLLIIETINADNIMPTSQKSPSGFRSISPLLLSSLAEHCGFARVKILRFEATRDLLESTYGSLADVMNIVNSAYAIIAQKTADETILKPSAAAFAAGGALNLETRMGRYIDQLEAKVQQLETRAQEAETLAYETWTREKEAGVRVQQLETRVQEAETKMEEARQTLNIIYSSRSWRMTAPIRWFILKLRLVRHGGRAGAKAFIKGMGLPLAKQVLSYINNRTGFRRACKIVLKKLGLYQPVQSLYQKYIAWQSINTHATRKTALPRGPLIHLSPRARMIYADLKAAIEKNRESL